ncbi:uncharacterized protein [Henckelia pumila]|uniref:uncharacterized protein n=1 Tax=Henckelia pumila TaxID=405737 RepID=UPI003C6E672C
MRVQYSLCQTALWGILLVSLLGLCSADHADDKTLFEVVGAAECADCKEYNIKSSQAFSGLIASVDCKLKSGETKRMGDTKLDKHGKFKISLSQQPQQNCYVQLHSAAAVPCAAHNGVESTKILLKSQTNGVRTFGPSQNLQFSTALCASKTFWPFFKHPWKKISFPSWPPFPPFPPIYKHKPLYPPVVKPLPPPVPLYKPPAPVYKPPVPVYKPPVPVYKPPVPVYKPKPPVYKPKPPVYKPPVPVYKPKPPVYKPPVPVYKPKPPVYKPPVPVYKPKPPVYKPPVPVYKPPVPVYKPKPPVYKPPVYKKPCPPLIPKLPPLPKIKFPPKYFHHPKFGHFPPLPPYHP